MNYIFDIKVNLDLKLLTYGILASGQKDGIMEFVGILLFFISLSFLNAI